MAPLAVAEAQTVDRIEGAALRHFLDREIELLAGDEVDGRRGLEAVFGLDRDLGADKADLQLRVGILQRLGDPDVGGEGRRRGVQHRQFVVAGERQNVVELEPRRRRVDQLAVGEEGRRLGEPSRVPERADLALGLIARTGAAVEAVEGRRVQEQGLHHRTLSPSAVMRPLAST